MSAREAGPMLLRILAESGGPRRLWVAEAGGRRTDRINIAAVSQVIAHLLWEYEGWTDTDTGLPRRIRDRVRRALNGAVLTHETLNWFGAAFQLDEDVRQRLHDVLADVGPDPDAGPGSARSIAGADARRVLPTNLRCRTVSLHEHHYVGADRCPSLHRTTQVLQATEDRFATYHYLFDTNTIEVEVVQGGRIASEVREVRDGIYGVEIAITRPLDAGQTATLVYESRFSYPQPPAPEFRRAAFHGVESLDLRVEFDRAAVPAEVTFAQWPEVSDREPETERIVPIEPDLSVHEWLPTVQNCVVGFRWRWD